MSTSTTYVPTGDHLYVTPIYCLQGSIVASVVKVIQVLVVLVPMFVHVHYNWCYKISI